jgi:hypothetical protein
MSRLITLVELRGFEPLTYSMRTSRATNCAIAPRSVAQATSQRASAETNYWPAARGKWCSLKPGV